MGLVVLMFFFGVAAGGTGWGLFVIFLAATSQPRVGGDQGPDGGSIGSPVAGRGPRPNEAGGRVCSASAARQCGTVCGGAAGVPFGNIVGRRSVRTPPDIQGATQSHPRELTGSSPLRPLGKDGKS